MHGISCFASDAAACRTAASRGAAREAAAAASFGVVVVAEESLANRCSIEEMHGFLERGKLIPVFFALAKGDCVARDVIERRGELWRRYGGGEGEWKEVLDGLSQIEVALEANAGNLRGRILQVVELLGMQLGRRSVVESAKTWRELAADEFPFPRNANFVGRKKELHDLEVLLFREEHKFVDIEIDRKGKKPLTMEESEECIEIEGSLSKSSHRSFMKKRHGKEITGREFSLRKGVACVCGDSGIGKTELLLEFAYKFSQRYKMVLWVGGEARYLRENYMRLLPKLGVDVGIGNEVYTDGNGRRSFEDIEGDAIAKVRKELMRDIPFLLVIDNLESDKDWWDGRSIMELLPYAGGETHVLISTRLPQLMNVKPLRLLYLSSSEAMSLMTRSLRYIRTEDIDALRIIEDKIGRLPMGLALAGAILSELQIDPPKLLNLINKMPLSELTWGTKEDRVLNRNPFLVQLLDFCFSVLDQSNNFEKLALGMAEASTWFAPSPIPISFLSLAACEISKERKHMHVWRTLRHMISCSCMKPRTSTKNSEDEASSLLIRLGIAKRSTKERYLSFHDIIKLHARRRSNVEVARAVVRAIIIEGSVTQHYDHIWAACFLLFKFGMGPAVADLSTRDLVLFIKQLVLPLVSQSFRMLSMYNSALELLRLASNTLDAVVDSFISGTNNESLCLTSAKRRSNAVSNALLHQDLEYLRATILETRALIMLKGGQYDRAEQLCRTAVSIKEVIYGAEHPETLSSRRLMERSVMLQLKF